MHDGRPYGRNQGQGQGHSREVDRQSPTGLIFFVCVYNKLLPICCFIYLLSFTETCVSVQSVLWTLVMSVLTFCLLNISGVDSLRLSWKRPVKQVSCLLLLVNHTVHLVALCRY